MLFTFAARRYGHATAADFRYAAASAPLPAILFFTCCRFAAMLLSYEPHAAVFKISPHAAIVAACCRYATLLLLISKSATPRQRHAALRQR